MAYCLRGRVAIALCSQPTDLGYESCHVHCRCYFHFLQRHPHAESEKFPKKNSWVDSWGQPCEPQKNLERLAKKTNSSNMLTVPCTSYLTMLSNLNSDWAKFYCMVSTFSDGIEKSGFQRDFVITGRETNLRQDTTLARPRRKKKTSPITLIHEPKKLKEQHLTGSAL
jgi:hypothetical protein